MYAVIQIGGKQYKVAEGDELKVEKIDGKPDEEIRVDKILLIEDGKNIKLGRPHLAGAVCICKILSQEKDKKKKVYKYKRRKDSARTKGHRQFLTKVKVEKITS